MADTLETLWQGAQEIPDPILAAVILAAALAIAIVAFRLLMRFGRRFVPRGSLLRPSLAHIQGPLQLAVIVVALRIATAAAPVANDIKLVVGQILQVTFVVLLGWIALVIVNIAADIYLRRFRIDVEDNLLARKHVTQTRVLRRSVQTLIVLITIGAALMSFDTVRQIGVSLFASAGIAGIVVGLAARPLLSSLIAGVQIAVTQPIRLDDEVVVEGEFGRVEEISATYVVVKLWDLRRLVVPLSYFMEKPFQNWTRQSSEIMGTVMIYADLSVPVQRLREKLFDILKSSPLWDGKVAALQVTEMRPDSVELRVLLSARSAGQAFDLRCEVREKLIAFLQQELPEALPRQRADVAATLVPSPAEDGGQRQRNPAPRGRRSGH